MEKRKQGGEKYERKYGVASSQIYKNDPGPDKLIIPPPGHFLYDESSPTTVDEQKVKQIDADGLVLSHLGHSTVAPGTVANT